MNGFRNAGFMDGVTGWQASSGLSLGVAETGRGASGRMVLRGSGVSTASGQDRFLSCATTARANVAGMAVVEVFVSVAAFLAGAAVPPWVRAAFYDAGGVAVETVTLAVQRPSLGLHGVAVAGLSDTFWRAYATLKRPANGVRLSIEAGVTSTANGQTVEVVMLKPYAGAALPRHQAAIWGPGIHENPDLMRRNWPSDLPLVGREGGQPKPWAITHDAGAGLPAQRRVSSDPVRKLTARVRADVVQRAQLEAFAADASRFWMVEPDTEKLCLAGFDAEGAPRLAEHRGGLHYLDVTLWLETA